jgi:hypothetical protein
MQDISNNMIIIDGYRSGRSSSWFLYLHYSRDSSLCPSFEFDYRYGVVLVDVARALRKASRYKNLDAV